MKLLMMCLMCFLAGMASASVYRCQQKNGKVELRDFPCDMAGRPAPIVNSSPSSLGSSNENYELMYKNCMDLISKYDVRAPLLRCKNGDSVCAKNAANEMNVIFQRLIAQPGWVKNRCDILLKSGGGGDDAQFSVVGVVRGCKYFVAEQRGSYSLIEEWSCYRPYRGDVGYGDIESYGIQDVSLNGMKCSLYVDSWLLGKSRAAEKLAEKCQ
ncbi:DUF4124 domain-containing protein [Chitinilyticum litopenaei]|uniref:DUF4124 domain-containing protein n=1 Tax=Chitinilyticum litopenaei TaxID=1121276 RepID=UPI001185B71B|nr:DUF4124 domain-containing protein [Chitinilyticum litopenaei]